MTLDELNAAPDDAVTPLLLACCDVPAWAAAVRDGRPYADVSTVLDAADNAARRFSAEDVERALAAHPRIGERPAGTGTEAAWSRQEQSGVAQDVGTRQRLVDANRAYEERFGRVFLICASDRSADQVLDALQQRLCNDEATEAAVVADELRKIALVRLRKVLEQ
jgi:2-oxo-4-hydroxy-4-carboxy-5-ureidoimidazoline decarboxylase